MTLTLPDDPALSDYDENELRLDLACALYSAGRVSRDVATRVAGMERADFDEELFRRHISAFSEESLEADLQTLRSIGGR